VNTNVHFSLYLAQFYLEWETPQLIVIEKLKRHISMFSVFFFNYFYVINFEKYSRAGQGTDENLAHALCMLGT